MCPRHSWLYFCAENELKYRPLGSAVLYDDLLGRALRVLHQHRFAPVKRHQLTAHETCFTCDYLSGADAISPGFEAEREAVEAAVRTRTWVHGCRQVWSLRVCPQCLPARAGHDGQLCRDHLSNLGSRDEMAGVVGYLDALAPRLSQCMRSMTHGGPPRAPDSDAALIEVLGWFAGWRAGEHYL